jgi:probable selenium-dependent hydroxylase accessory protein YqeC
MIERAATQWCGCRRFVVARVSENPDLFPGVSSGFGAALNPAIIPLILNEADGARSMSLKMPRQGEPVLMTGSKYLVPVIGLDCLNQPLGASTLFRWEYAREQFGLHEGDILSPDRLASILFHPQGVCKDWRPEMKIIPYINKVDAYEDRESALMLAEALLKNANFPVHHVVWGSVKSGISGQVASA